jgi:ribonucleoside-diphosphate reductase alpha chain
VLGSINLANMVRTDDTMTGIDWERLRHAVQVGIRFLDDVLEVSREPLSEIAQVSRGNRKIGLGVMGFAECLILLGVAYGSEEAIAWADRLMAFIAQEARTASQQLAEQRGVFPNWTRSIYAAQDERVRNATRLSIAPTGTLSLIAGTSGGIEPLFALAYRRQHSLGGAPLAAINPIFQRYAAEHRLDTAGILDEVLAAGQLAGLPGVPDAVRRIFVTATELSVHQHLAMQHVFQRHVDNAVSKTINLPEDIDQEEIAHAFLEGWRLGLKGVTVYRSGSKAGQVLTLGLDEEAAARELFAKCDPGACRL